MKNKLRYIRMWLLAKLQGVPLEWLSIEDCERIVRRRYDEMLDQQALTAWPSYVFESREGKILFSKLTDGNADGISVKHAMDIIQANGDAL